MPVRYWVVALAIFLVHLCPVLAATADGWDYSLDLKLNYYKSDQNKKGQFSYELMSFATILEYDTDTSQQDEEGKPYISDEELYGLAFQAYNEMIALHKELKAECDTSKKFPTLPTIISAMAVGNKVYIASGLRGGGKSKLASTFVYIDYPDNTLRNRLNACQQALVESSPPGTVVPDQHRSKGACAEIITIMTYYEHTKQTPGDQPKKEQIGRVASWGSFIGVDNELGGYAVAPCDDKKSAESKDPSQTLFGCSHFLDFEGVKDLMDTGESFTSSKRGTGDLVSSKDNWPRPSNTNNRALRSINEPIQIEPGPPKPPGN